MKIYKKEKKSSRIASVKYALNGIYIVVKEERNFIIHLMAAGVAIVLGFALKISNLEWVLLLITIGTVLTLEVINTAIERIMDFIVSDVNPKVKVIKDLSAGAVLIAACNSVFIACLLFLPKILALT